VSELTVQEAALAWAQGKTVEVKHVGASLWKPLDPPGELNSKYASPGVFSMSNFQFRLASVPPAKKWRPWTAEEVPVGAQVRYKNNKQSIRMLIVSNMEPHLLGEMSAWTLGDLFYSMEYSTDGGKTWLPCGVEVTE
jgi:hypothetical protein